MKLLRLIQKGSTGESGCWLTQFSKDWCTNFWSNLQEKNEPGGVSMLRLEWLQHLVACALPAPLA